MHDADAPAPSRPRPWLRAAAAALTALLAVHCSTPSPPPGDSSRSPYRLVLHVVVDQVRSDFLDRFRPVLTGGLRRLVDAGVSFTDAHHDHARTVTGAGHATLATGRYPSHHGIVGNYWLDREADEAVYCVDDDELGKSPRRLLATTLGDWLKESDPRSKVFSVSGKDRSAILSAGTRGDMAFWYDRETGGMLTSSYYAEEPPRWVREMNETPYVDRYFGRAWEPIWWGPDGRGELDLGRFDVGRLDRGVYSRGFPRPLGGLSVSPNERFYGSIYGSPFVDEYVGRFARAIVENEDLGRDDAVDLLAVAFSAPDAVGHEYGPNSPELLDTVLRLDRTLGRLLDTLDETVGRDRYVISLSADHGIPQLPEYRATTGADGIDGADVPERRADDDGNHRDDSGTAEDRSPANDGSPSGDRSPVERRLETRDVLCHQGVWRQLRDEFGEATWLRSLYQDAYLNRAALAEHDVDPARVLDAAIRALGRCPAVERVWSGEELAAFREEGDRSGDRFRRLFAHSYHPERSPDLMVQIRGGVLKKLDPGTTHGSPYAYDTWVPLILAVPGRPAAEIDRRVRTVDLAPTLARIVGVEPPDDLDGVDRTELLPTAQEGWSPER